MEVAVDNEYICVSCLNSIYECTCSESDMIGPCIEQQEIVCPHCGASRDISNEIIVEPDHNLYECHECDWVGEGVELTSEGECPKCYALLKEEQE